MKHLVKNWRSFFRNSPLGNNKGFSLLEAALTTALLGAGLWGSLAIFQNVTTHSADSDYRVAAVQLANEKLETIVADKAFQGYNSITNNNYPVENMDVPYDRFTRSVDVQEVSGADLSTAQAGSGFKKVNVTVAWGNANYQTMTMSTLVANY